MIKRAVTSTNKTLTRSLLCCAVSTSEFFEMSSVSYSGLVTIFYSAIGGVLLINIIHYGLRIFKHLVHLWEKKSRINKFAKLLPGPKALPILGNALELWETDKTVPVLTRIGRELNSRFYQFWLGPTSVKFIVSDPDDLEIILTSVKAADKDKDIYKAMEPAVINGLANAPGSTYYRAHKKLIMPQIQGKSVMGKHVEKFNHHSRICVKLLEKHVNGGEIDMHDFVEPLLGDITFDTLFRIDTTAQAGVVDSFLKHVHTVLHAIYYRMMRPWLYPDFIFRLTKQGKIFYNVVAEAHAYLDTIITKRKKEYKMLSAEETSELCLFDFLIDHMMKNKNWTDQEIRSEVIAAFIGSYEAIPGVASFLLLMIAMHPEIQERAREEVQSVMLSDNLSESELPNLKYVEMVIRETLRLFPVGPLLPRQLKGDLKLSKYTVPEGSCLFLLPFAVHRDPKYWDEPEKFNPERFTPENSKDRHPYAYIPFSGGMRNCPGSKYAMDCMKVITAHILRNYVLSTNMKFENLSIHAHLSVRSVNGYKIFLGKL